MANRTQQTAQLFSTERKKADAWLNIHLPVTSTTGEKSARKLGGIPLDQSDPLHKLLIEAIQELDSKTLHDVVCKLILQGSISFVTPNKQEEFTLG